MHPELHKVDVAVWCVLRILCLFDPRRVDCVGCVADGTRGKAKPPLEVISS